MHRYSFGLFLVQRGRRTTESGVCGSHPTPSAHPEVRGPESLSPGRKDECLANPLLRPRTGFHLANAHTQQSVAGWAQTRLGPLSLSRPRRDALGVLAEVTRLFQGTWGSGRSAPSVPAFNSTTSSFLSKVLCHSCLGGGQVTNNQKNDLLPKVVSERKPWPNTVGHAVSCTFRPPPHPPATWKCFFCRGREPQESRFHTQAGGGRIAASESPCPLPGWKLNNFLPLQETRSAVVFLFDGLKVLCAFSSPLFISSPLLSLCRLYTRFHGNHLYCIPDCEEKSCRCEQGSNTFQQLF